MSIQLELSVTGPQLASALLGDEEEFAYALKEMAEYAGPGTVSRLGEDIAGYLSGTDLSAIMDFLRALADAIELAE